MDTAAECLQFAVRFAQMDLGSLGVRDWRRLRADLTAFLGIEVVQGGLLLTRRVVYALIDTRPFPTEYPEALFRELQQQTQRVLDGVLDTRAAWLSYQQSQEETLSPMPRFSSSFHSQLICVDHASGRQSLCITGSVYDLYIFLLQVQLVDEPPSSILRCPECRTIFYRVGKQKYCSRPCTNRVNARDYRHSAHVKRRTGSAVRKPRARKGV